MNDQEKYLELLNPVYRSIERYVISITDSQEQAKEILQETVAAGFEKFKTIKSKQAFLSFMFTIAKRKFIDYIRAKDKTETISNEDIDLIKTSDISPEDFHDIQALKGAIKSLDENEKDALSLHEFSGFKIKEIAQMQSVTVSAVKMRIHRAKKKLAEILGAGYNENSTEPIKGVQQ